AAGRARLVRRPRPARLRRPPERHRCRLPGHQPPRGARARRDGGAGVVARAL
ncbi:MAG: hypothetical protein AVDCRST_MAG89-2855, partial [uncultured Gemmatimonadetes bacterium]